MPSRQELLRKLSDKKDAFIESSLDWTTSEASAIQRDLLELIYREFIGRLKTENGKLLTTAENFKIINEFDELLNQFQEAYINPFVQGIGERMTELVPLNSAYYTATGASKSLISNLNKQLKSINDRIGIDKTGEVIPGSYLDNLSKTPEVRNTLRDYITKNVANGNDLDQFQRGFAELLTDTEEVNGALTQYYQQYTFDTFNQVDATINKQFADGLDLQYFIYSGTLIKTSRCFCRKRNNKVFHVSDTENWKNDPTLPDTPNYDPLIDRGSYNCRHAIRFISEELAQEMGYDKARARAVVSERCAEGKQSKLA